MGFLPNIKVLWLDNWYVENTVNFLDYEILTSLKYLKIQFNAPIFDRVTKDRAAKFVDQLSAIGGTMGLLTGFSIISGVEIVYFFLQIIISYFKKVCKEL